MPLKKRTIRYKKKSVHFSWPTGDTVKNSLLLKFLQLKKPNTEKTRKNYNRMKCTHNDNEIVSK